MSDLPIDREKLPPTDGTVVAHRLLKDPVIDVDYGWRMAVWKIGTIIGIISVLSLVLAGVCYLLGWERAAQIYLYPFSFFCMFMMAIGWSLIVDWPKLFAEMEQAALDAPVITKETVFPSRRKRIDAIANSPNALERDHIELGLIDGTEDAPALLHMPVTTCHWLITGASESGKTHRVITPLLHQLIIRMEKNEDFNPVPRS